MLIWRFSICDFSTCFWVTWGRLVQETFASNQDCKITPGVDHIVNGLYCVQSTTSPVLLLKGYGKARSISVSYLEKSVRGSFCLHKYEFELRKNILLSLRLHRLRVTLQGVNSSTQNSYLYFLWLGDSSYRSGLASFPSRIYLSMSSSRQTVFRAIFIVVQDAVVGWKLTVNSCCVQLS